MISMERKDCNVSLSNIQLEVEELEVLTLQISTLEVALEEVVEDSLSGMLRTYSKNSLEVEILLLDSWTMTTTSSLEILEATEDHQSKNHKRQISMTHSLALEVDLAVASEGSRALEALEVSEALMTMTSLAQAEEPFQVEEPLSKHQRSLRMEKR